MTWMVTQRKTRKGAETIIQVVLFILLAIIRGLFG
jgi:hypothetical protein